MRRDVIERACRKVIIDLTESGMSQMLQSIVETLRNSGREPSGEVFSLSIIADYINRVRTYSDEERQVLSIFELNALSTPEAWQPQFREIDPGILMQFHSRVRNLLTFLPQFINLIEREYSGEKTEHIEETSDALVQTVILADEGDALSSPQRIIELLSSVQQIYGVLAEIEGISADTLAVVGLDSGSEKSLDFLGVARLMHEFRETLQSVYNMVVFHKQNVTLKNLQVASETLTVVSKISEMQRMNQIDTEQANRMKHALYTGLERFAATGAYVPEMQVNQQAPALVMKPQPRLLTGPVEALARSLNDSAAEEDVVDDSGDNAFTEEEISAAVSLLKKANRRNSEDRPTAGPAKKRPSTAKRPRTK